MRGGCRVVVCCGVGGVGKTTVSAALGLGMALSGKRTAVLTIDPARRLADALGLGQLGNRPLEVPLAPLGYAGPGSLHALMLDRKATWDEVIRRFSPHPEVAARLLANRYYQAVSTRLTGSHEYMAAEKLYDLVGDGRWDVVVVDTPPAQQAVDFLLAPERVRRVLDRRVLDVLVDHGRGGLLSRTTFRMVDVMHRVAGASVMQEIAEFFALVSDLSGGFRDRNQAVHELLRSEETRYLLVTAARAPRRQDVLDFLEAMAAQHLAFDGFLVNRASPCPQLSRRLTTADLSPAPPGVDPGGWSTSIEAMLAHVARCRIAAAQEREELARLDAAAGGAPAWWIPEMPGDVRNLEGLARIARHLPPAADGEAVEAAG